MQPRGERGEFASAIGAPQGAAFGAELERQRRRRGLSYDALAQRSGYSRAYIREVCVGSRGHRPGADTIAALARALELEPDAFRLYRLRVLVERHADQLDALYAELYGHAGNGNGRAVGWDSRG